MLHLPILRRGRPYRSVEATRVPHFRTKETFVELSAANSGLVRRDLLPEGQAAMRAPVGLPTAKKSLLFQRVTDPLRYISSR